MTLKPLDPRLRGDDGWKRCREAHPLVMPAKAGIQGSIATGL